MGAAPAGDPGRETPDEIPDVNDTSRTQGGLICVGVVVVGALFLLGLLQKSYWALAIPVAGNGDVESAADAVRMLAETGCDAVMIGRASMKNPWIYRQTAALLAGAVPVEPTLDERRDLILDHFRLLMEQELEPKFTLHKLRTFTGWYTHGLAGGKALRTRIQSLEGGAAFVDAVTGFFEQAREIAA